MPPSVNIIDLKTLQSTVKAAVEKSYPFGGVWVKAEIASISTNPSGHRYLELSQSEGGKVVAKVRATIWSSAYPWISSKFTGVTGESLRAGMEILVKANPNYHVLYGMSLNIVDIDPTFSLGAREAKRRQTVKRLQDEGLLDLQKGLHMPELPYRLAVISASGAAGYGDFMNHLLYNEYGYAYSIGLFPSVMQGQGAPESICRSLQQAQSAVPSYDAILILRGGGSELDLECFDDYSIAAAVARCPIPVISAIGHDRDSHVLDMVANNSVKTPTALADFFIECTSVQDEKISSFENRLNVAFSNLISREESAVDSFGKRIASSSERILSCQESRLGMLEARIMPSLGHRTEAENKRLDLLSDRIKRAWKGTLEGQSDKLESLSSGISLKVDKILDKAEANLDAVSSGISLKADNLLSKGNSSVDNLSQRISRGWISRLELSQERAKLLSNRIIRSARGRMDADDAATSAFEKDIFRSSRVRLSREELKLQAKSDLLRGNFRAITDRSLVRLEFLEKTISIADPNRILSRGVPLILDGNGAVMKSIGEVKKGDRIGVKMDNVRLDCTVDGVRVDLHSDSDSVESSDKGTKTA